MSMTKAMRAALTLAEKNPVDGLRRIHDDKPGAPPWPAPAASLHALVRRGYLEVTTGRHRKGWEVTIWKITPEGRTALHPPQKARKDTADSMRAKGWATTRVLEGGVWVEKRVPEPEKVTKPASATEKARQRWERDRSQQEVANRARPLWEQLRDLEQLADTPGTDVRGPLREIGRQIQRGLRRAA